MSFTGIVTDTVILGIGIIGYVPFLTAPTPPAQQWFFRGYTCFLIGVAAAIFQTVFALPWLAVVQHGVGMAGTAFCLLLAALHGRRPATVIHMWGGDP